MELTADTSKHSTDTEQRKDTALLRKELLCQVRWFTKKPLRQPAKPDNHVDHSRDLVEKCPPPKPFQRVTESPQPPTETVKEDKQLETIEFVPVVQWEHMHQRKELCFKPLRRPVERSVRYERLKLERDLLKETRQFTLYWLLPMVMLLRILRLLSVILQQYNTKSTV